MLNDFLPFGERRRGPFDVVRVRERKLDEELLGGVEAVDVSRADEVGGDDAALRRSKSKRRGRRRCVGGGGGGGGGGSGKTADGSTSSSPKFPLFLAESAVDLQGEF